MSSQPQLDQPQLDQRARQRVLKRVLARHVSDMRAGHGFSSAFHLVYVGGDGDPLMGDVPLKMSEWLNAARGDIDGQLDELAAMLSNEQVVRQLAETIAPGFVGLILAIHAQYQPKESRNLIGTRQEMVVASLVTMDERVSSAYYLLDDNAIELADGSEQAMPWDSGSLKQLLFTLDDALRMHFQQKQDEFVVPFVLIIKEAVQVSLPDQAQQAPANPRMNL